MQHMNINQHAIVPAALVFRGIGIRDFDFSRTQIPRVRVKIAIFQPDIGLTYRF